MKRRLKQLGWGVAGLILFLVVFVGVERVRGRSALEARLKELAAQGEKLSIADFEPKRPPADQNAFVELGRLHDQIKAAFTNDWDGPPSFQYASPGHAVTGWRLAEWPIDKKTNNNWARFGATLERARPLLAAVRAAVREPGFDTGFDYHKGFVDFHLAGLPAVKEDALFLNDFVLFDLKQGNLEAVGEDLAALAQLAAKQTPEPLVICQLVRQACATIAFQATWEALQAPGWTDAQLGVVQSAWEGCDLAGDMARAMEMERALTLDFYSQIKASREKLSRVLPKSWTSGEPAGWLEALASRGAVPDLVRVPLWRTAWAEQDELVALNRWQVMIDRERIARTNSWASLADRPGSAESRFGVLSPEQMDPQLGNAGLGWYDRARFLFYNDQFSITDDLIRTTLSHQTEQQIAVTALAICRYRLKNGSLPADLPALVPKFLRVLPHDSMDGGVLRYRPRPDGSFLLYSAGEDGKDDGGDPSWRDKDQRTSSIWSGRDAVWPLPDEAPGTNPRGEKP